MSPRGDMLGRWATHRCLITALGGRRDHWSRAYSRLCARPRRGQTDRSPATWSIDRRSPSRHGGFLVPEAFLPNFLSRRRSTICCGATRTPRLHRNECRLPAAAPSIGPIAVMIRARVIRPHQRRPSVRGADCEHIRVTTRAYRLVCGEYTGALSGCPTRDFRKMQHPTFQPPPGASAEVAVFPANHAGVACSAYRQTLAQLGAGTRSVGVRVPGLCEAEGRSLTPDRKSVVKSSRPD
jgi:hypothetical protein